MIHLFGVSTIFSYERKEKGWWVLNLLCRNSMFIVFNVINISLVHRHEGGNESAWCSFLKLSDLLFFYCLRLTMLMLRTLMTNLFCVDTIVLALGKIWWVFYVCLQFTVGYHSAGCEWWCWATYLWVLENFPQGMIWNSMMIKKFGIRTKYLSIEHGEKIRSEGKRKHLECVKG